MSRSSIGDVVARTLAAEDAQETAMTGERTIEIITGEILHYQAVGGDAVIQIGKRLIEAKEMLPHGGWLPWLSEQVNYSERTAQRLMKIARECSNPTLVSDLGQTKALALLALPDEEQKALLEAYDVPNMSRKELEDAIRERDRAREERAKESERADEAESERDDALQAADALRARIRELESRPVDVAVQVDEKAMQKAADEARRKTVEEWQKKTAKLDEALLKAEAKLKEAKEKAEKSKADAEAGRTASAELEAAKKAEAEAKAESERLREELEKALRAQKAAAVAGDAEVSEFKLYFGLAQENVNRMRGLLLKVRGREDKTTGEKLAAALNALGDAVKEAAK